MIEDCKKVTPVLIVWLGASTTVYLYIYWSHFGVNPFEYISFYEVLSYSGQYFVMTAGLAIVIGITELIIPSDDSIKHFEGDMTTIRVAVFASVLTAIISLSFKEKWPFLASVYYATAPMLSLWVSRTNIMKEYIGNQAIRIASLIFIFISPFAAVNTSLQKADDILKETHINKINIHSASLNFEKKHIYVGKLGEYIFLKGVGKETIYSVRTDQVEYITYSID